MDWIKNLLQILPLETISDILGEIVIWWSQMVKDVPPADLPMYAYLGGAIIVLILWVLVARMLPRPLGGMSWMVLFAVLLSPSTALGDSSLLAPASISVIYAIMMKDIATAVTNALPILVVLVVGLFIGFVWQLIRGAIESSLAKARRYTAEDTQATMQLATGNYLITDTDEPLLAVVPTTDINLQKDSELQKSTLIKKDSTVKKDSAKIPMVKKPTVIANNDLIDKEP
ncbi:hypothetical protein RCH20_000166 [Psychrobacter sp. PL15]|uniref:hypothetical protein n=1 Tax=Psychrobacter sp. PL15 TaxID=3071719 RepID=UPI002E03110C|nr:hypothetical protein [Psychrobacter sp. PL15]